MRKIMLIAALVGFAGTAYADGEKPVAPPAPPVQKEVDNQQARYVVAAQAPNIQFRYAKMKGYGTRNCEITIAYMVNGQLIQVQGDTAEGNGRGILYRPNPYSPDPRNRLSFGNFAVVGDRNYGAVIVEVRDPVTGEGLMGIYELTRNFTGLEPASPRLMYTSGFLLDAFEDELRTELLISDNLATRFEQAQTPQQFLLRLANRRGPPDVVARPPQTCNGPGCGPVVGPAGLPPHAVPYGGPGVLDPTIQLRPRY